MRRILMLVGLACVLAPALGWAQEAYTTNTLIRSENHTPPAATVEDFAWLVGHFRAEALGGWAEEAWSPPEGGSMMGMFRLMRDDAVVFYEMLTLTNDGASVVLRLKHFNADLTGWEEKDEVVTFPLVRLTPHAAYFEGMTFHRIDADTVVVYVATQQGDGELQELTFAYQRVAPSNGDIGLGVGCGGCLNIKNEP